MITDRDSMDNQGGYIILVVLIFIALSGFILAASLNRASTNARTLYASKVRTERFYDAETALSRVTSWLRQNSQQIITPYRRTEFYDRFDRTVPTIGTNDTGPNTIPTSIKMQGTNDSVIITNDASLGTAAFPPSKDITTNTTFDVLGEFAGIDLGDTSVRITLVDAIADVPADDFGDTDLGNPSPGTDFYPIYYVQAYSGDNENAQVTATVTGDVVHIFDLGIYGQDYLEINQPCDSYLSSAGNYSAGTKRANCPAGSNSTSAIHKNEEIYGSLQTNGDIDADPPYGGDTCADFTSGCPNKGETCAGEDCGVPLLEIYDAFNTYCPTDQGSVTFSSDTTLTIVDSDLSDSEIIAADRCWDTVTVNTNTVLTLEATNSPYYFRTLDLKNNSNSQLNIQPNPAGGQVAVWVETIVGDKFNGNQVLNTGTPTEFQLIYLGASDLTMNGTAAVNAAMVAPNAGVSITGTFDYHGALLAKELTLSGSGQIHYDESLGGSGDVSNMQYRFEELVQRYR